MKFIFKNPERVRKFNVYKYQRIDYLSNLITISEFIKTAKRFFNFEDYQVEEVLTEIKELFHKKGWNGYGEVKVIWIPPFVDLLGQEDSMGTFIWHVLLQDKKTSLIATEKHLTFNRLQNQNGIEENEEWEAIHIVQDLTEDFDLLLQEKKNQLEKEYHDLQTNLKNPEPLIIKILGYYQCDLISHFHEYMDQCYYQILQEVINHGNTSKLKLKKSSVKIDLKKHNFIDKLNNEDYDVEGLNWLSLGTMVYDIYNSYKFEPFKEKLTKLTSCINYKIDPELRFFIQKHVIIRNCIQHQNWKLDQSALSMLGAENISIDSENIPIKIHKWKQIIITLQEILKLIEKLKFFTKEFSEKVDEKVSRRNFRKRKNPSHNNV